jgi:hypothetical protein
MGDLYILGYLSVPQVQVSQKKPFAITVRVKLCENTSLNCN